MKTALTSINKPHIDNILSGDKEVEWRTKPLPIGKHLAYETKRHHGSGMVTGIFEVVRHYRFNNVDEIPDHCIRRGMVSREFLKKYAKGRTLYANIIISPERFITPHHISEYIGYTSGKSVSMPPQSFMYVK